MLRSITGFWTIQGISYDIFWTREMMDLTVEFGEERQPSLLYDGPGGDVLNSANVRGLWSVSNINCLPSNMKRKWPREE